MGRRKTIGDEEVVAAARAVFRELGHGASTRDVARAAGVSQAVLYQRFATKDDLFFRAMSPDPVDLAALLGPYPPADARQDLLDIAARLRAFVEPFLPTMIQVMAYTEGDTERLRAWHDQLPFRSVTHALADRFAALQANGLMRPGDPAATALAVMSIVHSSALFSLLGGPGGAAHGIDPTAALLTLWRGLEPR